LPAEPLPPLARTASEEQLYLELHRCECGSARFERQSAVHERDGVLISRVHGDCVQCGRPRAFLFRMPEVASAPVAAEVFFGAGRSELLDPGEWLFVADRYAEHAPAAPPPPGPERDRARRAVATAYQAMRQMRAFVDEETGEIPQTALRSALSDELREHRPSFLRDEVIGRFQQRYRALLAQYDA